MLAHRAGLRKVSLLSFLLCSFVITWIFSVYLWQRHRANSVYSNLRRFTDGKFPSSSLANASSDTTASYISKLNKYSGAACVQGPTVKSVRRALWKELSGIPADVRKEIILATVIEGVSVTNFKQKGFSDSVATSTAYSYVAFWTTSYSAGQAYYYAKYSTCVFAAGVTVAIGKEIVGYEEITGMKFVRREPCNCGRFGCAECTKYEPFVGRKAILASSKLTLKSNADLQSWMLKEAVDRANIVQGFVWAGWISRNDKARYPFELEWKPSSSEAPLLTELHQERHVSSRVFCNPNGFSDVRSMRAILTGNGFTLNNTIKNQGKTGAPKNVSRSSRLHIPNEMFANRAANDVDIKKMRNSGFIKLALQNISQFFNEKTANRSNSDLWSPKTIRKTVLDSMLPIVRNQVSRATIRENMKGFKGKVFKGAARIQQSAADRKALRQNAKFAANRMVNATRTILRNSPSKADFQRGARALAKKVREADVSSVKLSFHNIATGEKANKIKRALKDALPVTEDRFRRTKEGMHDKVRALREKTVRGTLPKYKQGKAAFRKNVVMLTEHVVRVAMPIMQGVHRVSRAKNKLWRKSRVNAKRSFKRNRKEK